MKWRLTQNDLKNTTHLMVGEVIVGFYIGLFNIEMLVKDFRMQI